MSLSPRLFVTDPLYAGASVSATPGQAHYLGKVMRRVAGDRLRVFNGRDGEWVVRLAQIGRGQASFTAETPLRAQVAEGDLWLAFALLKRDATDLIVQKATELGVARLLPVLTARTTAERVNPERLSAIAIEAAEQCERLTLPEILPPQRLEALLAGWPEGRRLTVAMERSQAPPIRGPAGGLLVGPEGGFTAVELDALHRFPLGVPATLGPLVLRAETAAIVGLALLQAHADAQGAGPA